MSTMYNLLHIPLCTVMLILIFNSTAYCHAHSFTFYILFFISIFHSSYLMFTSLVLFFSIFALSMERTRLSFHCWLYSLCIVVYVTNKTWNLKLETWNQGPRVWRKRGEAQNPRCLRSSVKFPQSVMVWGAMSSAGVGPLCFLRSKVNTAVYQEVLEHFMLPAADQLYGDADFIFQQDLAPAHSAKATSTWFKGHGIPVLNWPANSPDLNPIENLWGIVKRKMRYARPNNAEELKATIRATWASHNTWAVPQTDRLHATPHCCSNSGKRSPN